MRADPRGACPCGAGAPYGRCCGPLHAGARQAATAVELMRARYCAYVVGEEGYVLRTWHPRTRPATVEVTRGPEWLGLEVLDVVAGAAADAEGEVRLRARYRHEGSEEVLEERSRFVRRGSRWVHLEQV